MKKRAIWIAAAACVILLCGCSHSEEAGAYLSTTSSTVEEKREGSETNSSHSFSESKPEDATPAESKKPMEPAEKEEAVEQPSTASAKGQMEPQPGNTASAIPDSSKQPASAGLEESEPQPEAAPVQQPAEPQPPAAPAEPEQPAMQPTAPTEPSTPTEPQAPAFDVSNYVGFAQSYGQGIGLSLDSTATACWDDPIAASSRSAYLERDLKDRLDWYAASGFTAFCVWAEDAGGGNYLIYIGYA